MNACCAAFAAVNDEYQRRLIAANFQREPPLALALYYGSPLCAAARRALVAACYTDPRARAFVCATAHKHWRMLQQQRRHHQSARALDQLLVWLCRDALAASCDGHAGHHTNNYDFIGSVAAAATETPVAPRTGAHPGQRIARPPVLA